MVEEERTMILFSVFPEDLKKETLTYLHKKYYDVVLDELLLVTEWVRLSEHNALEVKFTIINIDHIPRWVRVVVPLFKTMSIRNILNERKRKSGKMASIP